MRQYKARDILHVPIHILNDESQYPIGSCCIVFDDGEIITTWRSTVLSVQLWAVQRKYPEAPLFKRHHLGNKRLVRQTTSNMLGDIVNDGYDAYKGVFDALAQEVRNHTQNYHEFYLINHYKRKLFMSDLWRISLNALNDLYNFAGENLLAHFSTLSMFDVFEILDDPKIKEINAELIPDDISISRTHSKLIGYITDPNSFPNNNIAEAAKSNLVSVKQMAQLFSSLGYRTDCDYTIFKHPILTSGYHGYNTLHDFAIESRSAPKALVMNKAWLSNTQYTNRRIIIIDANLMGVIEDDCGNRETIPLFVKTVKDLVQFEGKSFYLDVDNIKWMKVDMRDGARMKELVGKTINFRTHIRCKFHIDNYVCSGCMGDVSRTVPLYMNIGVASSTILGDILASRTLSVKHLDGNAKFMEINIPRSNVAFMTGSVKESVIRLNEKGRMSHIVFKVDEIPGIKALQYLTNTRSLIAANISNITQATGVVTTKGETQDILLSIQQDARDVYLSRDMIEYLSICMRNNIAEFSHDGGIKVPLELWDYSKPAFEVSRKNENITDTVQKINTMILGSNSDGIADDSEDSLKLAPSDSLYAYETPEAALMALYQLVNALDNVEINIVHLENMIIAFSGIGEESGDYRIARGHPDMKVIQYSTLQYKRSFAQLLSLNQARKELNSPTAYLGRPLSPHPFDELIVPERIC